MTSFTFDLARVPSRSDLRSSPCTHRSLLEALRAFEGCDPTDARRDCELLLAVLIGEEREVFANGQSDKRRTESAPIPV